MKDRLINLGGSLAALAVLLALFGPGTNSQQPAAFPTTVERGEAGLYAMNVWLQQAVVSTYSLRERYSLLQDHPMLKGGGHVLIVSWPFETPARDEEFENLLAWLDDGNQMVVLAALSDLPRWSMGRNMDPGSLLVPLGLQSEKATAEESAQAALEEPAREGSSESPQAGWPESPQTAPSEPLLAESSESEQVLTGETGRTAPDSKPRIYHPVVDHPLFDDIDKLEFPPALRTAVLDIDHPDTLSLPLLQGEDTLLWYLASERIPGGMLLFADSAVFSNAGLERTANGRLLANYLNLYLGDGGHVVFDDFHQGLSDLYDPGAFLSDPRFHRTVYALLLLWLAYMTLYSGRFGPLAPTRQGIAADDFIHRVGRLIARHVPDQDVNRQLLRGFNNHYRHTVGLPANGETVAPLLATDYRFDDTLVTEFQWAAAMIEQGKGMKPARLQDLLARLQERI